MWLDLFHLIENFNNIEEMWINIELNWVLKKCCTCIYTFNGSKSGRKIIN